MDAQPRLLWQPSAALKSSAQLSRYLHWLAADERYGMTFPDYQALWQWSIEQPAAFWESLWQYFSIISHTPYNAVMSGDMPHTQWFEGSTLNYAEHVFRQYTDSRPAILFQSEFQPLQEISWATLKMQVASLSAYLKSLGVQPGDCVAGFLTNIPEASVALLATMSIGAIWTSASPDFGVSSVVERFGQVAPKVLIAVTGYQYGGRFFDKTEEVVQLQAALPMLQQTILIPQSSDESIAIAQSVVWADTLTHLEAELTFTAVPFAHPLWVLYSSGTTGIPKAITHSHGGMLLEHLKYAHFHADIHPGERFFWFTTTGWMMWNFLHATLLAGATIMLYDGSPRYPNMGVLWKLVEEAKINHFGVSAAYVLACMKLEVKPSQYDLSALRAMGCTGSPLPPEGFDWIYQNVKADLWLGSMSGGTDVCTAFVGGNPLLPVYEGEIQCRALGCAMAAFDEEGHPLIDEVGEMVITQPMPCMPIYFWNDPDFSKYQSSYFEMYPGIWRHGDWLKITPRNTLVILGRSDATLNRQGIRIGTSEIYRSVEKLEEIKDSLILHLEQTDGESWMPLFVTLKEAFELTAELKKKINQQIRSDYSPRHVPDAIFLVPDIPYTISGKKLELPVKKILQGKPLETAVNLGSVRNPDSLTFFQDFSREENK